MTAREPSAVEPCKCHRSHAYVTPLHSGHCCFHPETQTCHQDEVAAWEAEHARLVGGVR